MAILLVSHRISDILAPIRTQVRKNVLYSAVNFVNFLYFCPLTYGKYKKLNEYPHICLIHKKALFSQSKIQIKNVWI
jgi:hypothetical protein